MNRLVPVLLAAILIALLAMLWQLRPARVSPYVPIAVDALQPDAGRGLALPEPVLESGADTATDTDALSALPAPWADSALPDPVAGDDTGLSAPAGQPEQQRQARDAIRDRLLAAVESGAPDPAKVGGLIQELIDTGAGEQVAGVDLAVLRDNLAVAAQIQELASQMEQFSAGADMESPQTAARLQEYAEQLQQLQQQYRVDFTRPGGGARP